MHEDQLRDFVQKRIDELNIVHKADENQKAKFKFKASTISNVLPSGHVGE